MVGKHEKPGSGGLLDALAPYKKSLYPLGAALLGLAVACLPFTDGGTTITSAEWSAFGAAVAAAGVAWIAPKNRPKKRKGEAGRKAVERARERGESVLSLTIGVLLIIVLVLVILRLA